MLKRERIECDKYVKKNADLERKNDRLDLEKQSYERTIEIQKKQLLEQIRILTESLACERTNC